MAFSLSNWFKGKPSDSDAPPAESQSTPPPPPTPKLTKPVPSSVRTVTPNTVQAQAQNPVSLRDPSAPRTPIALPTAKMPPAAKVTPIPPPPRKVSMGETGGVAPAPAPVPPAPSVPSMPAFTPTAPDVTVSLEIGDFLDRLPPGFLQPGSFDRHQKVEFQASELYSDLARGRASVPASVIYRRCPQVFVRPVSDTEDVEVQLPLQKLVEQMGTALSPREDQVQEENVGEIETPFLQVAMEDNARLPAAAGSAAGAVRPSAGITPAPSFRPGAPTPEASPEGLPARPNRPGHISTISPVKMPAEPPVIAPPTAATTGPIINGKRPPSTVRASVAGGKIRVSGPAAITRVSTVSNPESSAAGPVAEPPRSHSQRISLPIQPSSPSHQVSKKTARIQIPPISLRTGGPSATPRPPSTPSNPGVDGVPGPHPGMAKDVSAPVTFRTSPPPPSTKAVPSSIAPPRPLAFPPPAFPVAPPAAPAPTPLPVDDRKIDLGLAAVLRGLPSTLLAVEPSTVPDDVRITLPLALIERQLSQGRVSVPRETFIQALPTAHREVLSGDDASADIAIPLQEVFQNLPANALTMRTDQVKEEPGTLYPTPFSQKAEEDAQRFSGSAPVPAPVVTPETAATPDAPPSNPAPAAETTGASLESPMPPATDVELPPDAAPERERDMPLDLGHGTTVELPPIAAEPPADVSAVEAHPSVPEQNHQFEDAPVVEAPAPPPEPPADALMPPVFEEPLPEAPVVATPPPALPIAIAPLPEPAVPPTPEPVSASFAPAMEAPAKEKAEAARGPAPAPDSTLQILFMTEEELDAKTVVKLVCQLPAVDGCAVMFEDGLRLAGNFPEGDAEGFSAMAAPFYKRASRFVSELALGSLQTFTLHTEHGLLSFFMHDSICLSVHHTGRGFMPGVREKLEVVTRELARMYATAKPRQDAE